jgi:hypothetical protein
MFWLVAGRAAGQAAGRISADRTCGPPANQWTGQADVAIVSSVPPPHPEHDAVSREVRRWYNAPVPEIGLEGTEHWFGFVVETGPYRARAVLSIGDPA